MPESRFESTIKSIMTELHTKGGKDGELILFALDSVIAGKADQVPSSIYDKLLDLRLVQSNGKVHEVVRTMAAALHAQPNSAREKDSGLADFGGANPQPA